MNSAKKDIQKENLERQNRENFRVLSGCLSRPGTEGQLSEVFGSYMLAAASVLLYQETTWYKNCSENFTDISLITGSKQAAIEEADYLFLKNADPAFFNQIKKGTLLSPEMSASLFFACQDFCGLNVRISGPGIEDYTERSLPVCRDFVAAFIQTNAHFPMGAEVFFISDSGAVTALSRTTKLEII